MAGKDKKQSRAQERAERLAELQRAAKAQERRRNLMIGGVVGVVLIAVVASLVFFTRSQGDVNASEVGSSEYGLVVGPEDAPHTMVIYEDFLCPFCGNLERTYGERFSALAEEGKVRIEYRPFTLLSRVGPYSAEAVSAFGVVLDESGPEVAKKFHDELYADQPEESASEFPGADWFVEKAVAAGATEADVRPGIEAGENDFARGATKEAEDAGVNGTPTVILDGDTLPATDQLGDQIIERIEE